MTATSPEKSQASDSFAVAFFIILSGGLQDAYTYLGRGGVFANAQTGNIVLLATDLFQGQTGRLLNRLVPLSAFLLGIIAAESICFHLKEERRLHWRQWVLLLEILLLFLVAFLPQWLNPLANALVSFVCALQVQSFHTVKGHVYASTMCIGNLRCTAEAFHAYLRSGNRRMLQKAGLYLSVIILFALGAGLGSLLTTAFASYAILASCPLLFVSFLLMNEGDSIQ